MNDPALHPFPNCPVDLAKLVNLMTTLENFLRPRAVTAHQKTLVGQLAYLTHNVVPFSPQSPQPSNPVRLRRKFRASPHYLAILQRDHFACTQCGCADLDQLTIHHLTPLFAGGSNDPANLTTLCSPCHRAIHEQVADCPTE